MALAGSGGAEAWRGAAGAADVLADAADAVVGVEAPAGNGGGALGSVGSAGGAEACSGCREPLPPPFLLSFGIPLPTLVDTEVSSPRAYRPRGYPQEDTPDHAITAIVRALPIMGAA